MSKTSLKGGRIMPVTLLKFWIPLTVSIEKTVLGTPTAFESCVTTLPYTVHHNTSKWCSETTLNKAPGHLD